jgi:hypothetical protein
MQLTYIKYNCIVLVDEVNAIKWREITSDSKCETRTARENKRTRARARSRASARARARERLGKKERARERERESESETRGAIGASESRQARCGVHK